MLGYMDVDLYVRQSLQFSFSYAVLFLEQVMSADKHPSIFPRQIEAIVSITVNPSGGIFNKIIKRIFVLS